jgi:protein gp37
MKGNSDWWDLTWNVTGGCLPVSPGCRNCYAARIAGTLHQQSGTSQAVTPLYAGTTDLVNGRYVFNGKLNILAPGHPGWTWPLRRSRVAHPLLGAGKPSLIFVGDMADLFYERVPTAVIDRVVGTIALSDHIGLLLTKRTPRMLAKYFASLPPRRVPRYQQKLWLGFSAERQKEFDERWADMRDIAANGWTVFVSIAPMIGPVRLPPDFLALGDRGWVICSGEQGPGARCRDLDPTWARALRDQCKENGVPFFMKQLARKAPIPPDLLIWRQFPRVLCE